MNLQHFSLAVFLCLHCVNFCSVSGLVACFFLRASVFCSAFAALNPDGCSALPSIHQRAPEHACLSPPPLSLWRDGVKSLRFCQQFTTLNSALGLRVMRVHIYTCISCLSRSWAQSLPKGLWLQVSPDYTPPVPNHLLIISLGQITGRTWRKSNNVWLALRPHLLWPCFTIWTGFPRRLNFSPGNRKLVGLPAPPSFSGCHCKPLAWRSGIRLWMRTQQCASHSKA